MDAVGGMPRRQHDIFQIFVKNYFTPAFLDREKSISIQLLLIIFFMSRI
jgi:hypothetical protein